MFGGGYDGHIRIDTRIDERGFDRGIKSMGAKLKGLGAVIASVFAVGAVAAFGKSAVRAASDLAAAMTGLKSILDGTGQSFGTAQRFINDFIADGLVPATNAINAYKNLALRGYDTSQIERTLLALKDAAAFGRQSNLTLGDAIETATSGLKQENSILVDNAGVTKNVARMWADYAKSIGTTAANLTQQQKIQAEVNGILEETRYQTGDAAKLTQGYAGQVAALKTSLYNLKVALGNAIIPVLQRLLPVIKGAIDGLVVLVNQLAQVMGILFGVKAGMDAVAAGAQAAAESSAALADATEAAGEAAKGALAPFDELNVLASKPESAAADAPQAPPIVDPEAVDEGMSALEGKVKKFLDRLMTFLAPVREALGRLVEALRPLGEMLLDGLAWAWENVLKPLGEWAVTTLLPAVIDVLAAGFTVLTAVLEALKPLGLWLWEEFLKPLGEWAGERLIEALGWLRDRLYDLAGWINEHQGTVQTIAIVIGAFAAALWLVNTAVAAWTAIAGVAAAVTTAFGAAVAFLTSPIGLVVLAIAALIAIAILLYKNWDTVKLKAGEAWDFIKRKWGEAKDWFRQKVLEPVVDRFKGAWEDVRKFASNAWEKTKQVWQDVKAWFKDQVTDPVARFFTETWDGIKTKASEAWQDVKATWGVAWSWFQYTAIDPIKNAFNTALDWIRTKFGTVFGGVKLTVKNAVNMIIGFINTMISAIASGLNTVIEALNSIGFTVPDWVPGIGGQGWHVSIQPIVAPQVPYLATGAVIPPNAEFLAVLGDQRSGRNIEAPEALIRRIVREEAGQVGPAAVTVRFEGTLGALARVLKPTIEQENRRVGRSLIRGTT